MQAPLQLLSFTKVTTQSVVGEPLRSSPCLAHWTGWVAREANTGAVLWGFSADQCVFPLDFSLPHVPGHKYDLSKIFIKSGTDGDGVIVCGAA